MKKLSVLLLIFLLSGCSGMRYGNFTHVSQRNDLYLANESVSQLTRLYPPARNTFYIRQRVRDGFGIQLIQALRKKGYGVIEHVVPRQHVKGDTQAGNKPLLGVAQRVSGPQSLRSSQYQIAEPECRIEARFRT